MATTSKSAQIKQAHSTLRKSISFICLPTQCHDIRFATAFYGGITSVRKNTSPEVLWSFEIRIRAKNGSTYTHHKVSKLPFTEALETQVNEALLQTQTLLTTLQQEQLTQAESA